MTQTHSYSLHRLSGIHQALGQSLTGSQLSCFLFLHKILRACWNIHRTSKACKGLRFASLSLIRCRTRYHLGYPHSSRGWKFRKEISGQDHFYTVAHQSETLHQVHLHKAWTKNFELFKIELALLFALQSAVLNPCPLPHRDALGGYPDLISKLRCSVWSPKILLKLFWNSKAAPSLDLGQTVLVLYHWATPTKRSQFGYFSQILLLLQQFYYFNRILLLPQDRTLTV